MKKKPVLQAMKTRMKLLFPRKKKIELCKLIFCRLITTDVALNVILNSSYVCLNLNFYVIFSFLCNNSNMAAHLLGRCK